jgi:hypothetical protein
MNISQPQADIVSLHPDLDKWVAVPVAIEASSAGKQRLNAANRLGRRQTSVVPLQRYAFCRTVSAEL